jgi:hypothetical protein
METSIRVIWKDGMATKAVEAAAQDALMAAGHALQVEAQRIVPHRDGTLEGSADTEPLDGGLIGARVFFGGPGTMYAAIQHELQMNHPNGRQWKYLETPFKAMAPKLPDLVGLKIRAVLKGGA